MTEQEALDLHAAAQEQQADGQHAEAVEGFEKAAEYFAVADGAQSPDLANVLDDWADSLLGLCRYEEALSKASQAKEILDAIRDQLDEESRAVLVPRAYSLYGTTLRELGRYEEASVPLLAAIEMSEAALGPDHEMVATHLNNYGVLCKYWGKFEEGEAHYLRALQILENEFGPDALETATIYHNLGGLEHTRGDFEKGEPLGRKAYEIRRLHLGEEFEGTVADSVAWGGLLDGLERYDESEPIYRRALAYYEERFGPEHFEVAATLNNLGVIRAAQGDVAEGRALLERCLAIKQKLFGESHPEVKLTRANLERLDLDHHNGRRTASSCITGTPKESRKMQQMEVE